LQDFLGRPIEIGDYVVAITTKYHQLMFGRVIKANESLLSIRFLNTWGFKEPRWMIAIQSTHNVLVVDDEYALQKILAEPISMVD